MIVFMHRKEFASESTVMFMSTGLKLVTFKLLVCKANLHSFLNPLPLILCYVRIVPLFLYFMGNVIKFNEQRPQYHETV